MGADCKQDLSAMPWRHDMKPEWFEEFENIINLAKWLADEGEITTAFQMLQIFEKPWKWESEWNEFQTAQESTTTCIPDQFKLENSFEKQEVI